MGFPRQIALALPSRCRPHLFHDETTVRDTADINKLELVGRLGNFLLAIERIEALGHLDQLMIGIVYGHRQRVGARMRWDRVGVVCFQSHMLS